jgi:hypothetical protein
MRTPTVPILDMLMNPPEVVLAWLASGLLLISLIATLSR